MKKVRASHRCGYGNIGHFMYWKPYKLRDFEIAGVVRRAGAETVRNWVAYPVVKN